MRVAVPNLQRSDVVWLGALVVAIVVAGLAFGSSLANLVFRWNQQEEYSHGFIIPAVTAWLLWQRRKALAASVGRPSWLGVALIACALLMGLIGELSAIYLLAQVGFVLSLMGLTLAFGGMRLLREAFVPVAFLLFAIPLPYFVDATLSLKLQLLSTEIAGVLIRLFGISVYLDGNVIDLGIYKLQVADACSGLRYLFPLMSLGFLAAYLFQAPFWQRVLVFLSTIPITILMNSFRIAVIAVLVNAWGVSMAEGMLHLFEGWVVFMACAALLAAEMAILSMLSGRRLIDIFAIPRSRVDPSLPRAAVSRSFVPAAACLALLVAGGAAAWGIAVRQEILPERARFASFPNAIGSWRGKPSPLDAQTEHALGLDDYVLADYAKGDGKVVNFYVAYYASQRKGTAPHSPAVCIPGGGWQIASLERTRYNHGSSDFPFNRLVIENGRNKQLVYYWFEQRGRRVANEWLAKWYLLSDSIYMNRTDGALVRITSPIYPGENVADAEGRIRSFIPDLSPTLQAYLPRRGTERQQALTGAIGRTVAAGALR